MTAPVAPARRFTTAASWTYRTPCAADHKALHDFSNMLGELQSAVERQDAQMQQWVVAELHKLYAEARGLTRDKDRPDRRRETGVRRQSGRA